MGDDTSVFKIFRVLWFPVSINAIVLGALGIFAFLAGTWIACLSIGEGDMATSATKAFPSALLGSVTNRRWPGFPVSETDNGRYRHADHKEESAAADIASDMGFTRELLGGWAATRKLALDADEDLSKEDRRELSQRITRSVGRYRFVFGFQLLLFFFVWSTFGVAVCRVLALRMSRDEYCSMADAMNYAWRVKLTGLLYPLAVLLPVAFIAIALQVAGWVIWIPFLGQVLGIVLLPFLIVAGLIMGLIILAAFVCLGLMPAAIAIERKGTYDSLGKAFNYVFARPLPLILHLVVTGCFLAVLHWLLVEVDLVNQVLKSAVSPFWDDGTFAHMITGETEQLSGWKSAMAWVYKLLLSAWTLLVWGALVSFFLGACTALFLILRKDVDGVDHLDIARDPKADRPLKQAAAATPAETPEGALEPKSQEIPPTVVSKVDPTPDAKAETDKPPQDDGEKPDAG